MRRIQITEEQRLELKKLRGKLLVLVGLVILVMEIFYYFWGLSLWEGVLDWFLSVTIASGLVYYGMYETAKILEKESQVRCDLESAKNELQTEVTNRTKELGESKVGLEKTVKERTKDLEKMVEELKEKNSQLELIEKMVVDRELKMVELKEEIERLQSRSGSDADPKRRSKTRNENE